MLSCVTILRMYLQFHALVPPSWVTGRLGKAPVPATEDRSRALYPPGGSMQALV
jgi:hypothetical protein